MTMHLSGTVLEIWPFEVLPGRLCQEPRTVNHDDVVSRQYYTGVMYNFSLH